MGHGRTESLIRLYLSNDTSSQAAGTKPLAEAWAECAELEIIRTSSRGAFFLEPMVERDTPDGRVAWLNVVPDDLSRIRAGTDGTSIENISFLTRQTRVVLSNFGVTRPLALDEYRARGGFKGLETAFAMSPEGIIDQIKISGLRG